MPHLADTVPALALLVLLVTAYGPLRRWVSDLVPSGTSYGDLMAIALLATFLANLLWRRTLVRHGRRPTLRELHRVSLVVTPLSLLGAVTTLAMVSH